MQTPVHLRVLACAFGDRTDVSALDDDGVREQLDVIREQGYRQVCVAPGSTNDLALAVTPGAPGGPAAGPAYDSVIVCTDATEDLHPGDWAGSYQAAAGLDSTPVTLVTGAACANVVPGIDAARGLIASGVADDVLLVLVDRTVHGTRYTEVSKSVYSDSAVSCLISREPAPGSFRVLATALEVRLTRDGEWNDLADARTTVLAMNRAAKRASGDVPAEGFAHVVTLNLGATARKLLSMATRVPAERTYAGPVAEFGHCYAADIPLNLRWLEDSGSLAAGDHVLALASSRGSLGAVSLVWSPTG